MLSVFKSESRQSIQRQSRQGSRYSRPAMSSLNFSRGIHDPWIKQFNTIFNIFIQGYVSECMCASERIGVTPRHALKTTCRLRTPKTRALGMYHRLLRQKKSREIYIDIPDEYVWLCEKTVYLQWQGYCPSGGTGRIWSNSKVSFAKPWRFPRVSLDRSGGFPSAKYYYDGAGTLEMSHIPPDHGTDTCLNYAIRRCVDHEMYQFAALVDRTPHLIFMAGDCWTPEGRLGCDFGRWWYDRRSVHTL